MGIGAVKLCASLCGTTGPIGDNVVCIPSVFWEISKSRLEKTVIADLNFVRMGSAARGQASYATGEKLVVKAEENRDWRLVLWHEGPTQAAHTSHRARKNKAERRYDP